LWVLSEAIQILPLDGNDSKQNNQMTAPWKGIDAEATASTSHSEEDQQA
jgi:hypothetical protein